MKKKAMGAVEMKRAKLRKGVLEPTFEISCDNFERLTGSKFPYEQQPEIDGGRPSQFAICPVCDNPVQLIGLYAANENALKYGKHTGKDIAGFDAYDVYRYAICPYAAHRRTVDPAERVPQPGEREYELYCLLRAEFDTAIYVLEKRINMSFGEKATCFILKSFINNKAYLYPLLSVANMPWLLGFFGLSHHSLFGQFVSAESPLAAAIREHCKNAELKENAGYVQIGSKGGYLDLRARFTRHVQRGKDGAEQRETVDFCVDSHESKADRVGTEIFSQTLEIDQTYFYNLINRQGDNRPRQQRRLSIAGELMPALCGRRLAR